jgi:hypothetical protein
MNTAVEIVNLGMDFQSPYWVIFLRLPNPARTFRYRPDTPLQEGELLMIMCDDVFKYSEVKSAAAKQEKTPMPSMRQREWDHIVAAYMRKRRDKPMSSRLNDHGEWE